MYYVNSELIRRNLRRFNKICYISYSRYNILKFVFLLQNILFECYRTDLDLGGIYCTPALQYT